MNKVITINLNGNAYQIDEAGYEKLQNYLAGAERQLATNPDRAEIIGDFEQAIADKCLKFINANKNVVSENEIDQIIREMGPVQGEASAASETPNTANASQAPKSDAPKRLYQIQDGAMISGLCNGIAAYLNWNVIAVRALFIAFAIFTQGFGILVYIALMLYIPYATTSEEEAAAYGLPFNAQEVLNRATKNYQTFRNGREWRHWKREFRRQNAFLRHEFRRQRDHWFSHRRWGATSGAVPMPPTAALIVRPFFGVVLLGLALLFAASCYSLVTTGAIFGHALAWQAPIWMELLALFVLYKVVASPFAAAHRGVNYGFSMWSVWGGMIETAIVLALGWWAYTNVPQVHEFIDHLPQLIQSLVDKINAQ